MYEFRVPFVLATTCANFQTISYSKTYILFFDERSSVQQH